MTTSRRAFSGALLLSAAAFSLRPRPGLARLSQLDGLSLALDPVLSDGTLKISVRLHNGDAARSVILPDGKLAVVLRHDGQEHTVEGQLPPRLVSEHDRMSRAGPRPAWVQVAAGQQMPLTTVLAPWPEAIPESAEVVVSFALPLRFSEGFLTLPGEGTVTRTEA